MKKIFLMILVGVIFMYIVLSVDVSKPYIQSNRYTIGVILKSMNSQHWMDVRSGIRDASEQLDVDTIILYPQTESSIMQQKQMFRDMLEEKPDAILCAPCDSNGFDELILEAKEKGIPVIAIDTKIDIPNMLYIGADNEFIGKMAGQKLIELMDEQGQIAIMSGVDSQISHKERVDGITKQMKDYPNMSIVTIENADSDFDIAMQKTKDIINAYPDIKGIFATSAVMSLGIVEQYKNEGLKVPYVVTVDTQDDALDAVQKGMLSGVITQDGYELGSIAIEKVVNYLDNGTIRQNSYISTSILTKDNIDDFYNKKQVKDE